VYQKSRERAINLAKGREGKGGLKGIINLVWIGLGFQIKGLRKDLKGLEISLTYFPQNF